MNLPIEQVAREPAGFQADSGDANVQGAPPNRHRDAPLEQIAKGQIMRCINLGGIRQPVRVR